MASPNNGPSGFITQIIIWACGGALLAFVLYFNMNTFKALQKPDANGSDCVRTQAEILRKSGPSDGYKAGNGSIQYAYSTPSGERIVTVEELDEFLYSLIRNQDSLEICYDPNQPELSAVPGNEAGTAGLIQTLLLDLVLLIGGIAGFVWYRKARRKEKA